MTSLYQSSVEIILENQSASGAYLASPNFETYHYCWFRDGAFIAFAMDLAGRSESAKRFHNWATDTVIRRKSVVEKALEKARQGERLTKASILDTRYAVDGSKSTSDWPNFQLDGFGTWLWSLEQHIQETGTSLTSEWQEAIDLVAAYLTALWQRPCYDCWEEFPQEVHLYTLAAIHAGLSSWGRLRKITNYDVPNDIKKFILEYGIWQGHFVKYVGANIIDASLLGLAVPYEIVVPDEPLMQKTVKFIESSLMHGGGLHRYATDTYYGGGEWILLTAWLGWYYSKLGLKDEAHKMLNWIQDQANSDGFLPEQLPKTLNDPSYYEPWRQRWGDIATPLLWSHAMYIILCNSLN